MLAREVLLGLGGAAPAFLRALSRHQRSRLKDELLLVYALYQQHGPAHLLAAMARADAAGTYQVAALVQLLPRPVSPTVPASRLRSELPSQYEAEARYGTKRGTSWTGYKVHLTETCDDRPQLLTQVETTVAPATDVGQLAAIQADLARVDLLPAEQVVDAGSVRGRNLVPSRRDHQIDLIGPTAEDRQWQAKAGNGFDLVHFVVDWNAEVVTCPQGRQSVRWYQTQTARDRTMIHVDFAAEDCAPCPVRSHGTRAKRQPRSLTLQPQAEREAIQAARQREATDAFAEQYARRAGIEGTISQGVRAFGLSQARYRGLAKTHLQHVATATAINIRRLADWLNEVPRAQTRSSPFAALAPVA